MIYSDKVVVQRRVIVVGGRLAALEVLLRAGGASSDHPILTTDKSAPKVVDQKIIRSSGLGFWKHLPVDESAWAVDKNPTYGGDPEVQSYINIKSISGNGFELGRIYALEHTDYSVEMDFYTEKTYSKMHRKYVMGMFLGDVSFGKKVDPKQREAAFGKSKIARGLLEFAKGKEITIFTSAPFIYGVLERLTMRMSIKDVSIELRRVED